MLLCLAACSVKHGDQAGTAVSGEAGDRVGMADRPQSVPCALNGAKAFDNDCPIERSSENGRTIVVVRHPNGGFRRLVELDDGARFTSADGAEPAASTRSGKQIEVTVEGDHYLFPTPGEGVSRAHASGS